MSPEEQERIGPWALRIADGTLLRLESTTDGRTGELEAFCTRLASGAPGVSVVRQDGSGLKYPTILLPNGVRYAAVPRGNEFEPFMEALAGATRPLPAALLERIGAMGLPATLELYVTPRCPHCPRAVRQMVALAEANRLLQLTVVDAALFPEAAARQRIGAVPSALLEGQFRWTGDIPLEEVVDFLVARDPATLGPASLEMMLKQGSARRLAELMAEGGALFPALLDLLGHPQWPTRLGAMVAVEELHARRPELARQALEGLWQRYEGTSDPVKGDILFLCGELGDERFAARLEAERSGNPVAELREAADDALGKLRRTGPGNRS
jgi:hypothetical protein